MVPWATQDPCLPPKAPKAIAYMAASILQTQKPSFYPKKHLQGASVSPRHLQIALLRSLVTGDQGGGTTSLKFLPLRRNFSPLGHRDRLPKEANGWPHRWKSLRLDRALSTESHKGWSWKVPPPAPSSTSIGMSISRWLGASPRWETHREQPHQVKGAIFKGPPNPPHSMTPPSVAHRPPRTPPAPRHSQGSTRTAALPCG